MKEIEKIWDMYPDVTISERLFKVLYEFVNNAITKQDHTQLASLNELAKVFDGIFINPKTGMPTADAINWIRKIVTMIRKDKGHPHLRPYTIPYVEITADGQEVVRYYLDLLMGNKAITEMNIRLEKQKTGLTEAQKQNRELANVKKVKKEAEEYALYIEQKQRDANDKKRRRR